ncbi:E3 ubiquitin-protein ligase ptr1 [Choanephora cucurbitarum]|uniref:HECT-type E3 ubiquitin transferase n=1 Tax=Choanephora cucurbitarum TaxID=101091 RepID=A0A1C7NS81_9FUNG|nr:E3 ubiquitin-protein ligase ptr1 [Choanephora cucurbitarum]
MKITRTPIRKSPPLPTSLATIVEHLVNDDPHQIKEYANQLDIWIYPRGDLFQFVTVLNRFDSILERVCEDYQLKYIQRHPFDQETKEMVLAILRFSKILFENCTNRNLYNSYEHLNTMLNTTDIDILEAVLRLMLKPAQRVNNPKAIQSSFIAHQDKITELARGSVKDLIEGKQNKDRVTMSFYRTEEKQEGLQTIDISLSQKTDRELFWELVEQYRIPNDYHFELLNKIRIANHRQEPTAQKQLLIIRFIALVIMAHTMSETIAQNRVFIYEPHLVSQIAQLVSYNNNNIPIDVQTYALYALDGIARHRTKVTEVLASFNASANHGILLHILRQLVQPDSAYTVEFLDALFTLLSFLLQTTAGSTMLMSAGIMSTLVQIMNRPPIHTTIYPKALIKVVGLLDTIMNHASTAFSSFCSANGLDILLKMIQTQVDQSIQSTPSPDNLTLIKNALRFLIRMMESSDTAEGLRNLVESSLPKTMMQVMEHQAVFGPSVFSLIIHVSTTFIHNEPTSLSVLQELHLPQTFLSTFASYEEPNYEVLMAAVHAFGAICLNSTGLDMFRRQNPLPHFFQLMTSPTFVSNSFDVSSVTALGTTMDELIRHQPGLKVDVFKCANQLLQQVIEAGHLEQGKPQDDSHCLANKRATEDVKSDCLLLGYVDLVARFLEGFLRNSENIKEFIAYGGPELLLRYYSLPNLPYDFSVTHAFDSLGYVFRVIADVSPMSVAMLIAKRVYETSRFIFTDLNLKQSLVYAAIQHPESADANALFKKFSVLFGYIGVLSTVLASTVLTNPRNSVKMVEWCIQEKEYGDMILLLGDIHRTMVWQNILLRNSVPKSWYTLKPKEGDPEVDLNDPQVINVRRFRLLLSEIPPALMPVLQGLIKVSVSRRNLASAELSLRTRARLVARGVAFIFKTSLEYMEPDAPDCQYEYYASMLSLISMLLLDDRSRMALETPIAFAFQSEGSLDILLDTLLPQFWERAERMLADPNRDETLLERIHTCIELLLAILNHLGCPKLLHNSPHTQILTRRSSSNDDMEDDFESSRPLNPYYWIAYMRLRFTCLFDYLSSPMLFQHSRHVIHSLLRCITQNLKQEGERPNKKSTNKSSEHESANRQALIAMGFEPSMVDHALHMFGFGLCALDYLFSRNLVQHPVGSGPPQLQISPLLQSSNPLTGPEFEAGLRILVNLWYDRDLATEALDEHNNLARAVESLAAHEPSAIRVPITATTSAVEEGHTSNEVVEDDDDEDYEDIDSSEEEEEDTSSFGGHYGHFSCKDGSKQSQKILSQLIEARTRIRAQLPSILANLVDNRSDIDFEIRDVMAVCCCGDPDQLVQNTRQTFKLFFGNMELNETDKRTMFESSIHKIRIFALMLREPAMQGVMSLLITTMADYMDWFEFLDLMIQYPKFSDPKWLTTLSLILEVGLAQSDEPKELAEENASPSIVTPETRQTLMNYCIDLLKMDTLSQDNLIAILRIIVRLTKHHAAAVQFVELGGLVALFMRPSRSLESLKVQQTYILMILRHIIESKEVLNHCMREWFAFWFTVPSARFLDVAAFIGHNSSLALRDPDVFLDVSAELYHLCDTKSATTNDPNKRLCYIATNRESSKMMIQQDMKAIEAASTCSSMVVHFLLNQLIEQQEQKVATDKSMAYTGFLLQCLFELVSSYTSCKFDIIRFSETQEKKKNTVLFKLLNQLLPYNAIHTSTDQERKKQGVSMWIGSLLVGMCYDATQTDQQAPSIVPIRQYVLEVVADSFRNALEFRESTMVRYNHYFTLAELCHRLLNARPSSIQPSLNVKEDTVMAMAQLMLEKEFVRLLVSVITDVDVNYPHAKLILNSVLRPLEQLTKLAIRMDRARLKSHIDLDAASEVIQQVERHVSPPHVEEEEEEEEMYIPMDTDEDSEAAEEEMNDLYRNSSLAMFDGTALEEGTSEDEFEEDDIEMASSGEEIIEDESDSDMEYETVSELEEGEEEDEEEDVDSQSESEDQEMEDLMRSHRYHHSDTETDEEEEDGDSLDDQTDASDDSETESDSDTSSMYSSSEYNSSNESLNSDRSESVHSEATRGDTGWHTEEDGLLTDRRHGHHHHRHHHHHRRHREHITAEIIDGDEDDMDIDLLDEDEDSDELNQEELEDMERNLELFHSGGGQRSGSQSLMNSAVHGALNDNSGNNTGRSADRDNVILHPLLHSAATPTIGIVATTDPSAIGPETAILSGANSHHLQAYEDIIGGSAVRILEDLLSQQRSQQQRIDNNASNPTDSAAPKDVSDESKDTLSLLKDFQPMQTTDRWSQEVQMVYISSVASSRATKLKGALIERLIEKAKKEGKDLAEVKADDPVEARQEEEEDSDFGEVVFEIETDEQPRERVTVMIHGEEVDITGTNIDVEFLEALPDDLRAEVYSQQMAERRPSIQSMDEDEISPEFLAALPSDIRQEVLDTTERYRQRQQQQEEANRNQPDVSRNLASDSNGQENDPSHPNLGMATLNLNSNARNNDVSGGPDPSQNTNYTTWRIGGGVTRIQDGQRNEFAATDMPATSSGFRSEAAGRKALLHRDAVRIVNRNQLASLARLLFVPQSISKALLNRLLLNLCENSKTRNDLLALLVSILHEGSTDLASVDSTFMHLNNPKGNRVKTENETSEPNENVPNLITQRCLEILYYVITWNDRSFAYFLTDPDQTKKRRHSTGNGNRKKTNKSSSSPILILIGLLDRPAFLQNTTLMEQLMNLLAITCRPVPSIARKYKEKTDPSKKEDNDKKSHHHRHTLQPPHIPEEYLQKIVSVLSMGECSSHTFQYTLSVLSHLAPLEGALDIMIDSLCRTANQSGQQIMIDLGQLKTTLSELKPGAEIEGTALVQFSSTTSHQARLLRVLKAMDYLYTRKRNNNAQETEKNEKAVLELYAKLDFADLWKQLGSCLTLIQEREDLLNVASVLLPLVESFMAVSKYSTPKSYNSTKTAEPDSAEAFFYEFTEEHKKILNLMVRNNPSLMSGSFALLIHNPKILEFDNKRNYFNQQLHKRTEPREHYRPLRLSVRRAHVFEDTYQKLQGLTGEEIKHGKLNVSFHNEEGVDAGGVAREWFSVLARQMFDPNYALFITSAADKLTYQPNRASGVNSEHLSYFKCVGRIIGKAIHDGRLLDAYFTRSFYKLMLGRSVDYRDVEAVDPAYYKSLVWMLENDITDIIDLTFSIEVDDFGTNKTIDLKPNGRNIPVTEANKHEYVSLITEQKLVLAIKDQVNAFLEGFHDIIPPHLIQIFNEQELELLISGLPDIDIDEWKANTVYEGYTIKSPQIQWFWRAVRSFDQEERAKLLQFSTGTSKVPLEGFAQLQGSNGVQKFQIHKEFGDVNRLPSAHTCFNQIDLPEYLTYEDLRRNLFKAISECSTGFAFQ